jgi:hypothetical protein
MPSPINTFAMSGRTYHKGERIAATDPAVIARPDLFDGVAPKPAPVAVEPRTIKTKKDGDR